MFWEPFSPKVNFWVKSAKFSENDEKEPKGAEFGEMMIFNEKVGFYTFWLLGFEKRYPQGRNHGDRAHRRRPRSGRRLLPRAHTCAGRKTSRSEERHTPPPLTPTNPGAMSGMEQSLAAFQPFHSPAS